jgi:RNA-directed DNA polymerase
VVAFENLLQAAQRAQRGKQDRRSVAHFLFHLEPALLTLQAELCAGTSCMQPYCTFTIYEPKRRQLCAAAFRDRVVHHTICAILDPIFEACLIHDTSATDAAVGHYTACV